MRTNVLLILALLVATSTASPHGRLRTHSPDDAADMQTLVARTSLRSTAVARAGLNGEFCLPTLLQCADTHSCVDLDTVSDDSIARCSTASKSCFCVRLPVSRCASSAECSAGEACARLNVDSKTLFCWSCRVLSASSQPVEPDACSSSDPASVTTPSPTSSSVPTPDASVPDADPTPSASPVIIPTPTPDVSFPDADPTPAASPSPSPLPSTSPDPAPVSTSAATPAAASDTAAEPATEPVPTLTGSPMPAPCIGSFHLKDHPRSALVFARDASASVLCDASGSCATAGHMVEFRGRAMRMMSYCESTDADARCTTHVMAVNSPRMRRGVRVPSRTPDLVFTALSARFGSRVEERCLQMLVRAGW